LGILRYAYEKAVVALQGAADFYTVSAPELHRLQSRRIIAERSTRVAVEFIPRFEVRRTFRRRATGEIYLGGLVWTQASLRDADASGRSIRGINPTATFTLSRRDSSKALSERKHPQPDARRRNLAQRIWNLGKLPHNARVNFRAKIIAPEQLVE
jgi:hypothetical protein